ncbi:MAG: TIM barrel protein [Bacillota bacterium]|nr:TIM barrel protein [Bacillota bacterium]
MKIRFGPSGNSASFYDQGYTSTKQAPQWLYEMGLDAFEYSFGKGVRITEQTAREIGVPMAEYDIALSIHAPYYINLATPEVDKAKNNVRFLLESARAASWMGAKKIILHPGSCGGRDRREALKYAMERTKTAMAVLIDNGYGGMALCPETMGKGNQLGLLEEILEICLLDEKLIPCIDFGHLHARGIGSLKSEEDFADILDAVEKELGKKRLDNIHIHFSRVEYTDAGEKKHWDFKDTQFGPDFIHLASQIKARDMHPVVICESQTRMAEDALAMKKMYLEA